MIYFNFYYFSKSIMFENKEFRTTSRWVVLNNKNEILLVQHEKWKKWVFPWWHVEKFESPHEWIVRELKEEFQIEIEFKWFMLDTNDKWIELLPLPIDSYTVSYYHKDFWDVNRVEYIFLCKYKSWNLTPQTEEIFDYKWIPIDKILKGDYKVYDRIKELSKYIKKIL